MVAESGVTTRSLVKALALPTEAEMSPRGKLKCLRLRLARCMQVAYGQRRECTIQLHELTFNQISIQRSQNAIPVTERVNIKCQSGHE